MIIINQTITNFNNWTSYTKGFKLLSSFWDFITAIAAKLNFQLINGVLFQLSQLFIKSLEFTVNISRRSKQWIVRARWKDGSFLESLRDSSTSFHRLNSRLFFLQLIFSSFFHDKRKRAVEVERKGLKIVE